MKSYSYTLKDRSTKTFESGGSISTSFSDLRVASIANLFVDISRNGDFFHPNPQRFVKTVGGGVYGASVDKYVGWYTETETGILASAGSQSMLMSIPYSALFNTALSRLNEQVRGSTDLSVTAAQSSQVTSMVRNAHKVVDFAQGLKGKFRFVGSKWLEFQYGWLPLVSDIFGSLDVMMKQALDEGLSVRVVGRSSSQDMAFNNTAPYHTTQSASFRCEIGVHLAPPSSAIQALAGYTSLNPVSLAWELLPYSFVVDWFVNVGDYLRNLETAYIYGSRFRRGWVTYGYRQVCSDSRRYSFSNPPRTYSMYGQGNFVVTCKERSALAAYPSPHLPVLSADLGSRRLLNAAALLSQHLR